MIFQNYENSKLLIPDVDFNNALIILIFIVLSVLSLRKCQTQFLDRTQTDQLKGFAIIMVVLGHLWMHVSQTPAGLIYGSYSVALFLFLSGFGLTLSYAKRELGLKEYTLRRISRVMLPYWLITALILLLDWLVLNKIYSMRSMVLTFLGVNVNRSVRDIDYVRWFITLLLVYYLLFYLASRLFRKNGRLFFLCSTPLILFGLKRSGYFPIGMLFQYAAFPLGCLLAEYKKQITSFLIETNRTFRIISALVLMAAVSYLISISKTVLDDSASVHSLLRITYLLLHNIQGAMLFLMPVLLMGWIGRMGYKSLFLGFCGTISYEMYLIHGLLLIKYNPVFNIFDEKYIAVSFLVLFVLLMGLSKLQNRSSTYLLSKIELIGGCR